MTRKGGGEVERTHWVQPFKTPLSWGESYIERLDTCFLLFFRKRGASLRTLLTLIPNRQSKVYFSLLPFFLDQSVVVFFVL